MTIAVLDTGFAGVDGNRSYLPANTTVVENYAADFIQRNNPGDPAFQRPFAPATRTAGSWRSSCGRPPAAAPRGRSSSS